MTALAPPSRNLELLRTARRAVEEARTVDDVKKVRDVAEALRAYAKQAGESLAIQNECAEIKLRAERRGGELLAVTVRPGNPQLSPDSTNGIPEGITRDQSSRWQSIASLPEAAFEAHITKTKAADEELTTAGVLRLERKLRPTEPKAPALVGDGEFATVVIDPPWPMRKIDREVRPNQPAVLDYPTMSADELRELQIPAAPDAHLYLWTTHKFLPLALELAGAWGFHYQCLLTWVKNVGFTPYSFMYSTEHVLFCRRGNLDLLVKGRRLNFDGKVREHSRKPEEFYDLVCAVSPYPRLEMFSREPHEGFEQWGNELERFTRAA